MDSSRFLWFILPCSRFIGKRWSISWGPLYLVRVRSDFSFQSYSTSCENDKCPLRDGEGYVMRHAAFAPTVRSWSRVWGRHSPTSDRPCDRTFSNIENLWPQVDTCFRPFRAALKISEVEPQCTLKILQSKNV